MPRKWTPDRDAVLVAAFAAGGLPAAHAALPDSTRSAVKNRAQQLGLKHPPRLWTTAEDAFLRDHYGRDMTAPAIAARLGRGAAAVSRRVRKLGLDGNRTWPAAAVELVRREYQTRGCVALATELLGSAGPLERHRVYNLAGRLGLTTPVRHPPRVYARVRELHAAGLNDSQIAREMARDLPGPNARERVTAIRGRRLKLPAIEQTHADRVAMGAAGRAKQQAAGTNPRDAAWERFARRYGLPGDLALRQTQIVLALTAGPKTRPELAAALGITSWHLNTRKGRTGKHHTYLSDLVNRGLIAAAPTGTRDGGRVRYLLTAEALAMLSTTTTTKESQ